MKISYDQGCNDIGVVIATKWGHYLFYLEQYFSALGTVLPKSFTVAFSYNSCLNVREVCAKSVTALSRYYGKKFLWLEIQYKMDNLDVRLLSVLNEALLTCNFTS